MSAWKRGDVALIEVGCWANRHVGLYGSDGWQYADDRWVADDPAVVTARPLVVIDPEDAEQVERLAAALRGVTSVDFDCSTPMSVPAYRMRAALREFANPTPPKPDEPQGLGAVVRDATGKTWVKVGRRSDWYQAHGKWAQYHSIDAVEVLSEGVTP